MNVARIYLGSSTAWCRDRKQARALQGGEDKTQCSSVWWGNRKRAVQGSGIENKVQHCKVGKHKTGLSEHNNRISLSPAMAAL